MRNWLCGSLASCLMLGSNADAETVRCGHWQAAIAPPDAPATHQYAPSRRVDILHLALDVTPDFQQRNLTGTAILRFQPIALPLPELTLDGVDLDVRSVTATAALRGWQATREHVIITFADPIPPDRETTVTIHYAATPKQGLYFRTPAMGYPATDTHLWTQGEPILGRHWYPGFDAPNEKFTSEVTCRVPHGMTVLSNGRRMAETGEANSGLTAVRWLQDQPHVNYLIALAAGYFTGLHDTYQQLPLAFYTPPSQFAWASNSFAGTKEMLAFFEQEIGVAYPWAKYYQVCVADFVARGMENTTLTVLTENTLFAAEFETLRSSQGLVAHELVHQWFGDLVTCKDWAHLWLNEGFATYYEKLYDRHAHGRDQFLFRLHQLAQGIFKQPNDTNAIVRRNFKEPHEQFSYLAYPKGAWVLHMLRSQLGEDLFRRAVKTFVERHALGTAITEDLVRAFEAESGRSLDQFFDQYVYHAHHPELNVTQAWDELAKLVKLTVKQTQKLSANVRLFNVPLPIRFQGQFGTVDRQIQISQPTEDFYFPLPNRPAVVRIDPDLTLLAQITFRPPKAMLEAQLKDASDLLGRLLAIEQLSGQREALAPLAHVLNGDPFYGARIEASKAIRAIGTDAAFQTLRAALKAAPRDARVRQQLTADVTSFYRDESCQLALDIAAQETNPDIQAVALTALGAFAKPAVRTTLVRTLAAPSFRNVLAVAAIAAMRAQDDPVYVPPLLACLRTNETAFPSRDFAAALDTLARLARHETNPATVREFLLQYVGHPKDRVQQAAIAALGTLGDPKAIAALVTFTHAPDDSPLRQVAEKAVTALRDARQPSAELGALRREVLGLQKDQRELRNELDDLKKKLAAEAERGRDPAGPPP